MSIQSEKFRTNPRDYALELVEERGYGARWLLLQCLKAMSHQDIQDMLDALELSPRFYEEES